jgi:hypothetical protein
MTPGGWESLILSQMLLAATPGTPPENRGTIPPNRYSYRIDSMNNPNTSSFPSVSSSVPRGFRNMIGYRTYVQFMLDHGRDTKPDKKNYVPLSQYSPYCPWHAESTAGGTFQFPPREMPTHAARRALIAAIQVVKERNANISDPSNKDWVSIIAYDKMSGGGPVIAQSLTDNYELAMQACTTLQACSDIGSTTATETALIKAKKHLDPKKYGGNGRVATNKVVVLLTDGLPNLYSSSDTSIDKYMTDNPSNSNFYNNGAYWFDAPLMQASMMSGNHWMMFPVGIGLGCDYDFMDRMARCGGTANGDGESPRGSGNPAEYEQRLTDIFRQIITSPKLRLVQ